MTTEQVHLERLAADPSGPHASNSAGAPSTATGPPVTIADDQSTVGEDGAIATAERPLVASPLARPSLDAAVAELRERQGAWLAVSAADRVALIAQLRRDLARVAPEWSTAVASLEGLQGAAVAEEVLAGPYVTLRQLRLLERSMRDIARGATPRIPGGVTTLPDGQVMARVMPFDRFDRIMYRGVTADVWMLPGVTEQGLPLTQAVAYREPDAGGVCLVLGGGNVSSIAPLDAIDKLFISNRVVLLKMHPTQAVLGPILEAGMAALIRPGFLRIVQGGAAEGTYLAHHPGVDELHITGSYRTYEAIVYGPGAEGDDRRRRDQPILDKPFTAELGNLTPVIIVPGRWSDVEIAYQADNVASMLTNNAGFNCTTPRVIITPAGWRQRQRFLNALRSRLAATPERPAYYPGAEARFDQFLGAHPDAELYGERAGGRLPWGLITDLDPGSTDDPCFTTEAFCSIFAELPLPSSDIPDYLARAVAFANDSMWGSLNATLIVHPASMRDPVIGAAVERAVANLHYGTVAINHWSALGFALGVTPWGAFPGQPRHDIGSGTDVVHNTLMFSQVEKTVIRAPFRAWPKPVWFATHRTVAGMAPLLVRFEARPSLRRLAAMLPRAVIG